MTEQDNKFREWDVKAYPTLQPDTCERYLRDMYAPRKAERKRAFLAGCQQTAELIFAEFDRHITVGKGSDAKKEIKMVDYEAIREVYCSVSPADKLSK